MRRTRFVAYGLLLAILLVAGLLAAFHRRRVRDALQDPLTGLANRRLLFTRLELLGPIQQRRKGRVYLFFLDLDGFKPVNDRHGHHAGDGLLVEIGRRLTKATRNSDTVARTGGDEVHISCISTWEVHKPAAKGRLALAVDPEVWVGRCERLGFLRFHPVNNSIARLAVTACAAMHADPADRIIVATALYLGASVVTRDDKIRSCHVVKCIW